LLMRMHRQSFHIATLGLSETGNMIM